MDTKIDIIAASHEERPHAERSASQLGSLVLCEGFRPRKSDQKKHWVTAQGSRGHEALETDDDGDLESGFEQRMVDMCRDYVDTLPPAEHEEREVRIETIEGRWGYIDVLRRCADRSADVVDWKFTRVKEVTAAEVNLQGKDYVVGVFHRYPDVDLVRVHLVMPRFEKVTFAEFRRADLHLLATEIFAVLRQARRSDHRFYRGATLTPHYDACRFCGAAATCRALRSVFDDLARAYDPEGYGRLPPVPTETHASATKDPNVLGQLKTLAAVARGFADAVDFHCLELAVTEGIVPTGYEIGSSKGLRQLVSVPALLTVANRYGVTADDLLECAKLRFGKLEEVVKSKAERGQKAKLVEQFFASLQENGAVERSPESPKLVRARPV